ncbi:MAG: Stp1/IreP family PP2C-type Ser/Thr phosphatase [Acidimicrobiia bacterium]
MKLGAGAASDVGRVRSGNEDAFLIDERLQLFAVADGMGGHQAGEVASATALEAMRAAIASGDSVVRSIERANTAVVERAARDAALSGMGTTLTAVVATPQGVTVGHVGDSRAYLLRNDELHRVTSDHSLVEALVREGRITAEQAAMHPQRSVITRALGIDSSVQVDHGDLPLAVGDRVLLCSDGLSGMVRDDDIANILRITANAEEAANRLVDAANDAGGEDNITAVVIDVLDAPARELAAPTAVRNVQPFSASPASESPERLNPVTPRATPSMSSPRRPGVARSIGQIVLWALPLLILLAIAAGATLWYSRQGYFAQLSSNTVTVYRGAPGGVLGLGPDVEYRSALQSSDLTEAQRADLQKPKRFSSRIAVDRYILRLEVDHDQRTTVTTTTTAPVTTTAGQ